MTIWETLGLWKNIRGISLQVLAQIPALNVDLITGAAAAIYLESLLGDSGKTKQNSLIFVYATNVRVFFFVVVLWGRKQS